MGGTRPARMPQSRLPRRMLTAWVDHLRPRGKSCYGYGHGHWLNKELNAAGICTEKRTAMMGNYTSWVQLAQDRPSWRRVSITNRMHDTHTPAPNEVSSTSGLESDNEISAQQTQPTATCTG